MAVRTNEIAVKNVLSTSLDQTQINEFIADASLWVTEELTDKSLSAGRLELIERYLACALIRLRDLGLAEAKFDDIREKYQVDPEMTDYMIRAASFDKSGTVRRHFLAGKESRPAQFRFGKRFVDV